MKSTCNDKWIGAKISFTAGFFGLLMFLLFITGSRDGAENILLKEELTGILTGANLTMSGWTVFQVCSSLSGALAIAMGLREYLVNVRKDFKEPWVLIPCLATMVCVAYVHLEFTLYILQGK